jgi:putative tryptophan/tyrosine transport system substrate-binding protein
MHRREFVKRLGVVAAMPSGFWPSPSQAQQQPMTTIGWLDPALFNMERVLPPFSRGLADSGYIIGRNLAIERRSLQGDNRELPAFAADLVRRHVAAIVAVGVGEALAVKAATQAIPVAFLMAGDPVETGVVASFNRPGGNLTGVAVLGDIAAKRLEILHKLVPAAETIAFLSRTRTSLRAEMRNLQSAAGVLGLRLLTLNAADESEVAPAFATLVEQQVGALLLSSNAFSAAAYAQIISLAVRHVVPTMYFSSIQVEAGGLVSYGSDASETFGLLGNYVGRILKGEKPADLPIVQPTRLEFAINLKTAKALGMEVPPTLLALTDKVIE